MVKNLNPFFRIRKFSTLIFFALLTLITGCAAPLVVDGPRNLGTEHKFSKNYQLGERKIVNVGDSIIRLQDYWVESTELPVVVPNISVQLTHGTCKSSLHKGIKYPTKGRTNIDGVDYVVVPNGVCAAMLLRLDGRLHDRTYDGLYELKVSDPSVQLSHEREYKINTKNGYENYEIIYNGVNASGLNLTYREFSPDGLARVAFFQNLTYEKSAKIITFKRYKIEIESASSESIVYSVLNDGR
jgi:hypothetical protein